MKLHEVRKAEPHPLDHVASVVAEKMRAACRDPDPLGAEASSEALARSSDEAHPGAAASWREGLAETLTAARSGVPPALVRTPRSTDAVESTIETCRDHAADVERRRDGQTALRWCAAGVAEAAEQFRRAKGYRHRPAWRAALDAHCGIAGARGRARRLELIRAATEVPRNSVTSSREALLGGAGGTGVGGAGPEHPPSRSAVTTPRAPSAAKPVGGEARQRARPLPLAPPVTTANSPTSSTSRPPQRRSGWPAPARSAPPSGAPPRSPAHLGEGRPDTGRPPRPVR